MKRIIRLTESDLTRIVRRVILEANDGGNDYYYAPGEERKRSNFITAVTVFPYTQPKGEGTNPTYDILGKKYGRVPPNEVPNQERIPEPKIPTSWFTIYAGEKLQDGKKIVGYHPTTGEITDPITKTVIYKPGKGMDDKSVYLWLYNFSGKGTQTDTKNVLVGDNSRKMGTM